MVRQFRPASTHDPAPWTVWGIWKHLPQALGLLSRCFSPDIYSLNTVIAACARSKQWALSLGLLWDMPKWFQLRQAWWTPASSIPTPLSNDAIITMQTHKAWRHVCWEGYCGIPQPRKEIFLFLALFQVSAMTHSWHSAQCQDVVSFNSVMSLLPWRMCLTLLECMEGLEAVRRAEVGKSGGYSRNHSQDWN